MDDFYYAQKGRSVFGVLVTIFVIALTLAFFFTGSLFFQVISFGLLILSISGIFAILKGEAWEIGVKDSAFSWKYPRWPRSSGTIDLHHVKKVVIDDDSATLRFEMRDGNQRKIRFFGGAYKLKAYLQSNWPDIEVKFIENVG